MKKLWSVCFVLLTLVGQAQSSKEERIARDIEVAENVLSTLIRQQLERRNNFWMTEVKGSYTPGFGVTLRVPFDNVPLAFSISSSDWHGTENIIGIGDGNVVIDRKRAREEELATTDKEKLKSKRLAERDSARTAYGDRLMDAAKTFLADYGDLISLDPSERILITTKSEKGRNYSYVISGDFKTPRARVISVEATKADLTQYKQGKLTRDQLVNKFKVLNSEINDETYPDLELLSTIFNRLYRSDLSKSYYMSDMPYYERMKDFGVTFFMKVYSSNEAGYQRWDMPTLDLEDLDQASRDKKVIELYPTFEKDLKENMIEYGRTVNSLKDEEVLIFDVALTRCKGCGIPATVELSVKASVLKEYGSGKISKDAALAKINVKKGSAQ